MYGAHPQPPKALITIKRLHVAMQKSPIYVAAFSVIAFAIYALFAGSSKAIGTGAFAIFSFSVVFFFAYFITDLANKIGKNDQMPSKNILLMAIGASCVNLATNCLLIMGIFGFQSQVSSFAILLFELSLPVILFVHFVFFKLAGWNVKRAAIASLLLAIIVNPLTLLIGISIFGLVLFLPIMSTIPSIFILILLCDNIRKKKTAMSETDKKSLKSAYLAMVTLVMIGIILCAMLPFVYQSSGQISRPYGSDPKTAIGNALDNVKAGGSFHTAQLVFQKGNKISSTDFESRGFDQHSIIFMVEQRIALLFDSTDTNDFSQISFITQAEQKITVDAQIFCEVTGQALKETLDAAKIDYSSAKVPGTCGTEEYQPCCLVIIKVPA